MKFDDGTSQSLDITVKSWELRKCTYRLDKRSRAMRWPACFTAQCTRLESAKVRKISHLLCFLARSVLFVKLVLVLESLDAWVTGLLVMPHLVRSRIWVISNSESGFACTQNSLVF
jgi:hypothetical protein